MTKTTHTSLRRAEDRFHTNIGWLNSYHSFSFGEHHDPAHMGFRSLRVINDDIVAPSQGFNTHPHRSMEIFTYIISGSLTHQDSMGNGRTISAGEFQYMSAGDGVMHSEFNASDSEPVHLLQIWITPERAGGKPRYQDIDTKPLQKTDGLALLASPNGDEGSIAIRQKAQIHFGHFSAGHRAQHQATDSNAFWIHLISGQLEVNGSKLQPGDGISVKDSDLDLQALEESKFLLFTL